MKVLPWKVMERVGNLVNAAGRGWEAEGLKGNGVRQGWHGTVVCTSARDNKLDAIVCTREPQADPSADVRYSESCIMKVHLASE